jgi:hypothetical protein
MKAILALALSASLFGGPGLAQGDVDINQQTAAPVNARYQLVQSTITMRDTYRLDTFTGRVHRLVRNKDGELLWEEMVVRQRPAVANPTAARFQIFLSGIAAKGSYMIDTRTGQTWQVVEAKLDPQGPDTDANKHTMWAPLQEENIE